MEATGATFVTAWSRYVPVFRAAVHPTPFEHSFAQSFARSDQVPDGNPEFRTVSRPALVLGAVSVPETGAEPRKTTSGRSRWMSSK